MNLTNGDQVELETCYNGDDLEIQKINYDPEGKPNSQRAIDVAAMDGLEVVFPKDNELQIDIDNEHSYLMFVKQMEIASQHIGVVNYEVHDSKSGPPKRHITVVLAKPINELQRLALQAMMGSDRVREILGYVQYMNNDPHPTLFLEKTAPKQLTGDVA